MPPAGPLHVRGAEGRGRSAGDGDAPGRARAWRPDRCLEPEPVRVDADAVRDRELGVILVNINPAYRLSELEYALGQSGCRWIVAAPECKGSDFGAMIEDVRPNLSGLERSILFGTPEWDQLFGVAPDDDALARRGAELDFDDPINIQYTSGTTVSRRRDPHPPQHPQQRPLRGRDAQLHRGRPGLHPSAAVPLLRDGDGNRCTNTARHGLSRAHVRPRGDPCGVCAGALHEPVRRADDVHRAARPPGIRAPRLARRAPGSWPARRARSRS